MKVFSVHPGEDFVRVSDNRTLPVAGGLDWGKKGDQKKCLALAKVILVDTFGPGTEIIADQFAMRFMWRVIKDWRENAANAIMDTEVIAIIDDIKNVERETRAGVQKAQQEHPIMMDDSGVHKK